MKFDKIRSLVPLSCPINETSPRKSNSLKKKIASIHLKLRSLNWWNKSSQGECRLFPRGVGSKSVYFPKVCTVSVVKSRLTVEVCFHADIRCASSNIAFSMFSSIGFLAFVLSSFLEAHSCWQSNWEDVRLGYWSRWSNQSKVKRSSGCCRRRKTLKK